MNNRIDLSKIDIVYPVRKLAEGNSELRYSLRSVAKNLPHRNVWVISEEIEWLSSLVNRMEMKDEGKAFENVNAKLMAAVENDLISDPFIFMMDDIFVMKEVNDIPYYALGRTLTERARTYDVYGSYWRDLDETQQILWFLNKPDVDFEVHAPILFQKAGLRRILKKYPTSGHRRTLYGNIFKKKPTYTADFKIYDEDTQPDADATYISTCVGSWREGSKAYQFVTSEFAEPCEYEKVEEIKVKEED